MAINLWDIILISYDYCIIAIDTFLISILPAKNKGIYVILAYTQIEKRSKSSTYI